MKRTTKIFAAILALMLCVSALSACKTENESQTDVITETTEAPTSEETTKETENTETADERFDYFNNDLSKYITVDPEIYKNLTLDIDEKYKITDELLQQYIDEIVGKYPDIEKVTDRPIVEGDTVYIYYEGSIDGVLFSGGSNMDSSEPYALTIGSDTFIDGFEDGLIGVVPSETSRENPVAVNARFPDSYHSSDVAGKEAVFNVVVEYIAEEIPAELNEEFVLKNFNFDPDDGDVVEQFRALALDDLNTSFRSVALSKIYEALAGKFEVIEYPQVEIDYQYEYYNSQFESYYNSYLSNVAYYQSMGLVFDDYDSFVCYNIGIADGEDWKNVVLDQCKLYVEETLFLYGIAQEEEFVIDENDYAESLDYLTKYYILYYEQNYGYSFSESQIRSMISSDMVIEHATVEKFIDLILEHATINYVKSEE